MPVEAQKPQRLTKFTAEWITPVATRKKGAKEDLMARLLATVKDAEDPTTTPLSEAASTPTVSTPFFNREKRTKRRTQWSSSRSVTIEPPLMRTKSG